MAHPRAQALQRFHFHSIPRPPPSMMPSEGRGDPQAAAWPAHKVAGGAATPASLTGAACSRGVDARSEPFCMAPLAYSHLSPYLSSGGIHTVMSAQAQPHLEPGRVYRTRELAAWSANAPRLAQRLVRDGELVQLAHGLYAHPRQGRFGTVPPADDELMRAFLDGEPFVFTGPEQWNALGLGSTAAYAMPLVYNTKRSGVFLLGGRSFLLRRVAFPAEPSPEWYVIDLLEHADEAGVARSELAQALAKAVARGRFDRQRLREMAARYGRKVTQACVDAAARREAA